MPPLTVMIKPVGGMCNYRCSYCFYQDELSNRKDRPEQVMSVQTLEAVLQEVLANASHTCVIAFQGGEPTLAGLEFYRTAVALEEKLNVHHCQIQNVIQTNGSLIDRAWADFFQKHRFLIGISLDGSKLIHDRFRLDADGKGTFSPTLHAIQLLDAFGVDYNILTVVTRETCLHATSVYRFFGRNGWTWQQYIPCLDPLGEVRGQHPWSLTPELYERFLKDLFDCWYQDMMAGRRRYNRYFDNLIAILRGDKPEACGMLGQCMKHLAVESDGSVYPCDFYMLDEWKLGTFGTDSLSSMEQRREDLGFVRQSAIPHPDCLDCRWKMLCRGGCRRDRSVHPVGPLGKNTFCSAYQHFFAYAMPRLIQLARRLF